MNQHKILVVEDEPIEGLALKERLEAMGYNVPEIIADGNEVIQAVLRHSPDLIIMDIRLDSFIDGVDAATRVRLIRDTPVIYLTAYSSEDMKSRAMKVEPVDYLLKPVKDSILESALEKVFG